MRNTSPIGLSWTIKRSFVGYVARMSDGRCSVTDGADVSGPPTAPRFHFGFDSQERRKSGTRLAFRGDVRFSGHHGLLFVRIADPVVELRGSRGSLAVLDVDDVLLELVKFDVEHTPDSDGAELRGTGVRLCDGGSELFGGVYAANETFDELAITLPADLTSTDRSTT
jgi:hypothetical protein